MPFKKDIRHTIIGSKRRASMRYYMIINRLKNTHLPRNANYKWIEMRISKEEFCEWFMRNDFTGASVDRIDSSGHYEFGNIRMIPMIENMILGRLVARDGMSICYICKEKKPLEEFVKDSRRTTTGRANVCRPCERTRKRRKTNFVQINRQEKMF